MKRFLLFALACLPLMGMPLLGLATIDAYDFKNEEDEQRFRVMVEELRCPKCQNQNIADSNAGLAKDIKDRVHRLINEGQSNREIRHYMVDRYGDFITYRPPIKPITWFMWFGPFVIALSVAGFLLIRKLSTPESNDTPDDPELHKKVSDVLKKLDAPE